MPVLENARHELFAQAIARGIKPSQAYADAGYKPNAGNACDLKSQEHVRKRIAELLSASAARTVKATTFDRNWVLRELVDNAEKAKAVEDFAASNAALRLVGSELSMFITRSESGAPGDFANLQSAAEVLELVRRELGDETAQSLAAVLGKHEAAQVVSEAAASSPEPTHQLGDTVQ